MRSVETQKTENQECNQYVLLLNHRGAFGGRVPSPITSLFFANIVTPPDNAVNADIIHNNQSFVSLEIDPGIVWINDGSIGVMIARIPVRLTIHEGLECFRFFLLNVDMI